MTHRARLVFLHSASTALLGALVIQKGLEGYDLNVSDVGMESVDHLDALTVTCGFGLEKLSIHGSRSSSVMTRLM